MKLIGFIVRHIFPIGLLVGAGMVIFSVSTPESSSRMDGIGVDLLAFPPLTMEAVESQLEAVQKSGSEYVRIKVDWTLIETTQDVYNWSTIIPLDLFFSSAQARDLKSVAVITGFPAYLSSTGQNIDQKTVGERWEKFIQAAVDHFGGQIDYWQIGEQINSTVAAESLAQADPAFYSKMLRSASKIIKKVDSNDEVWMGSLVSATAGNCAVNPLTFLLEVNGAKGWNSMDVITYQPRRGATAPESTSTVAINQCCNSSLPVNFSSISAEVQAVQDLARQLGGKSVYITGLIWSQDELTTLQANRMVDLNTLQSDLLVRSTAMLMGGNSIPLVFWQIDPFYQSISTNSMKNLNTQLGDAKSLGQIQGQTGTVQEFRFQKGAVINTLTWRSQDGDAAQAVSFTSLTPGTMTAFPVDTLSLEKSSGISIQVDDTGSTIMMLNERPVLLIEKVGGWDDQIKATASDQFDIWRIGIQESISQGLNQVKTAFLQWLENLFNSAKDSAVDWGEEQIKNLLD